MSNVQAICVGGVRWSEERESVNESLTTTYVKKNEELREIERAKGMTQST